MEIFQCLGLCELALLGCNAPEEVSSAVICILYISRNKELTSNSGEFGDPGEFGRVVRMSYFL